MAGATITVCTSAGTGTPCTPLATIYTTAALTQTAVNPITGDGLGNYGFWAPPGTYVLTITGAGITGTTMTITLAPGLVSANSWTADQYFGSGVPWYDVKAFGAKGDGSTDDTAAIQSAINAATNGGGVVYFPQSPNPVTSSLRCYKFGSLDLSKLGQDTGGTTGWVILRVDGCLAPTVTITLNRGLHAIVGGFRTNGNVSFHQQNYSQINGTGVTSGPVIQVSGAGGPFIISHISAENCAAGCIQAGTGTISSPSNVILDSVALVNTATSTKAPLFLFGTGFGVKIKDSIFNSQSTAPTIEDCGDFGQVYLDGGWVLNRTIKFEQQCTGFAGTGTVGTHHFQHLGSEAMADPALFTFDLTGMTGSTYAITIGPQVHMADNVAGNGLYMVNRTDATAAGLTVQFLGSIDGYTTGLTNGLRTTDTVTGLGGDLGQPNTVGSAASVVLSKGGLISTGGPHTFGSTTGVGNTTLDVFQTVTTNPAFVVKNMTSGAQGDLFQTQYSNGNPRFSIGDTTDIGGAPYWGLYNSTGAFLMKFVGTPTANRTWTFQDATDVVVGRATTDALTNKRLKLSDQGQCTMASGTCPAQSLSTTYSAAPLCFANWTGTGTLTGIIKIASTTTTVTPSSSVGTDTAQVNWACFGN